MLNHHIIVRQVVELAFPAGMDGFALQQDISRIVQEQLLPRMEALFDRFAGLDELIRIDQLELDLGHIPSAELEDTLVRTALRQLEEQLEIAVVNQPLGVERLPVVQHYFDQWLYFLEHGYRPPQVASIPEDSLQSAVLGQLAAETGAVERFRRLLLHHPVALVRLVRQHDEPFLVHLLEALTGFSQPTLPDYRRETVQWMEAAKTNNKQLIFSALPLYPPARFVETFWGAVVASALEDTTSNWTAENLFVAVLRRFMASVGPQQEALVLFWHEVARFKKTPYPLLKMVLDRHPQLLNGAALTSSFQETTAEGRPEMDSAALETPTAKTADPRLSSLDGQSAVSSDKTIAESKPLDHPAAKAELPELPLRSAGVPATPEAGPAPLSGNVPPEALAAGADKQNLPVRQPAADRPVSARTGDFWYVTNAGVILLHPFLSPFFKTVGLLDKGQFIDAAAQQKAVHLVHFLATGQTQAPEYDLVLSRFLCGLPFEEPLERFVNITSEEQAEGEKLIQAAISHWNRLGNTSPDGLREGFLQRDGKLEKREPGWYLGVEQKTIDILLDFLPWNLSMIKLPWMPELLRVEWA